MIFPVDIPIDPELKDLITNILEKDTNKRYKMGETKVMDP